MSDVSVLGCGRMGSALIRALADSGFEVTIWNRTHEKADALSGPGITVAESVEDAISASPTTLVSISNYEDTHTVLSGALERLQDETLVQLSSGRPAEAAELGERVASAGGRYVDGSIMAYPESIGTDELLILYSGNSAAFEEIEPIRSAFGGTASFVGEHPRDAAVHEMSLLVPYMSAMVGISFGALVCDREGVSLDWYVETLRTLLPGALEMDYDRVMDSDAPTAPTRREDVRIPESAAMIATYLRELDVDPRLYEAIYDLTATNFEEVPTPET